MWHILEHHVLRCKAPGWWWERTRPKGTGCAALTLGVWHWPGAAQSVMLHFSSRLAGRQHHNTSRRCSWQGLLLLTRCCRYHQVHHTMALLFLSSCACMHACSCRPSPPPTPQGRSRQARTTHRIAYSSADPAYRYLISKCCPPVRHHHPPTTHQLLLRRRSS